MMESLDWRALITIALFIMTQIGIAVIFGARLGTKVDSLREEFAGFKRDTKNDLESARRSLQSIGERIARIEGATGVKPGGGG